MNYNYTKSDVNSTQLHKEISDAALASATFEGLKVEGSSVTCIFSGALDSSDETSLESLVSSHSKVTTTTNVQRVVSDEESTTTETTWQEKVSITTQPLMAGFYNLCWYGEIKTSGTGVDIQVLVDGTEVACSTWHLDQYHSFSGFVIVSFSEGTTKTIKINYRVVGSGSAYIRRTKLALKEIKDCV